ncbi:unnamed protein product [Notodromas monacha]|uniref:Uncharacterized protein n=1 Tax=Notodromas monacha TaxID=399045 RepID=A0A7R9BVP7_9CRUS|nr:unnamed protein product [Notodromas monacha]CAG0921284.1 unnamed protein product [Notodromas monacha]
MSLASMLCRLSLVAALSSTPAMASGVEIHGDAGFAASRRLLDGLVQGNEIDVEDRIRAQLARDIVDECKGKILVSSGEISRQPKNKRPFYLKFFEECLYLKLSRMVCPPPLSNSESPDPSLKKKLEKIDTQLGRHDSSELLVSPSDEVYRGLSEEDFKLEKFLMHCF